MAAVGLALVGWGVFFAAIAWPALNLAARCVLDARPPTEGYSYSSRQLLLLVHSLGLAALASLSAVLVAIPAAYVVGRASSLGRRPVFAVLLVLVLLCPPMVYAFGWEKLLPHWIGPRVRCLLTWTLWAWPIPSLMLGAGWRRVGRRAYEAALLEAKPAAAFRCVALPLLRPYMVAAWLILFVLFCGDYGVPHACGLVVHATEMLGWAANATLPIDVVWPSVPVLLVASAALGGLGWIARHSEAPDHEVTLHDTSTGFDAMILAALGVFLISWALPMAGLTLARPWFTSLGAVLEYYQADLGVSLATCTAAAAASLLMALAVVRCRRGGKAVLAASLILGVLPGPLVGASLLWAYNRPAFGFLFDHWPIVALSYVSRFGWLSVLAAAFLSRQMSPALNDLARLEGVSGLDRIWHVEGPLSSPLWLCTMWVTTVLALGDVAASALVRVPSFTPVAHVLVEKFHRFEDGMIIALSVLLVAAPLPAAIIVAAAARRNAIP